MRICLSSFGCLPQFACMERVHTPRLNGGQATYTSQFLVYIIRQITYVWKCVSILMHCAAPFVIHLVQPCGMDERNFYCFWQICSNKSHISRRFHFRKNLRAALYVRTTLTYIIHSLYVRTVFCGGISGDYRNLVKLTPGVEALMANQPHR